MSPTPETKAVKITNDTELPLGADIIVDKFYERNPEFNPSWFAKLILTKKQSADLEIHLRKKNIIQINRNANPSEIVTWWTPVNQAVATTYRTAHNALVNTIVSPGNNGKDEIYIWWSSP